MSGDMHECDESRQVIYVAVNVPQAELLATALDAEGIEAVVVNGALQSGLGGLPLGYDTAPRVTVSATEAARARELVLGFERQWRESRAVSAPTRAWYQFTIGGLLFLTACIAVYFGVNQALVRAGGSPNGEGALAAQFLIVLGAIYLTYRHVRQRRRG